MPEIDAFGLEGGYALGLSGQTLFPLGGVLGRIGIVIYHYTDIEITQGEAASEAGPGGAGGVGGLYCL